MTITYTEKDSAALKDETMAHWGLINRLARKRFHNEATADEAALFVLDELAGEDWKRVRRFSGTSRFSTFLSSVAYRLLEDFSRKKFGRRVPPKWVRDAGGIWITLFRLLCLERFSFHEAVQLAAERRHGNPPDRLEQAAEQILGEIPNCGKSREEVEYREERSGLQGHDPVGGGSEPESRQRDLFVSAIGREIFGDRLDPAKEDALGKLLGKSIVLQSEEKLLLKLCFREGMSTTQAGRMLGLNRFQVHGRLKRLLARIRQHFVEAGCEEEIRLLLE